MLGVFTFVRVVECGAEDFRYGVAINRIRHYYKQSAGDQAKLFFLSGHDDGRGAVALVSLVAHLRYAARLLEQRTRHTDSIFPSPE